jgi:hypothetical protein
MRFSARASVAACLAAFAFCVSAVPALGTPSASKVTTATAPLVRGAVSMQIGPGEDPSSVIVITGVTLDPSVKLPAKVQIPIPPGAALQWSGEILGGDPSNDPPRQADIQPGAGGAKYAEFVLSQSHTGQVDCALGPLTTNGTNVSTTVDYVQSVPSSSTLISVRLPANISNVQLSPAPQGAAQTNTAGESLYILGNSSYPTGASQAISISYTVGTAASGSAGAAAKTPLIVVLAVALVAVVVAMIFVLQMSARPTQDAGEADEDEDGDFLSDEDDAEDEEFDEPAPQSKRSHGGARHEDEDVDRDDDADDADDDPFDILD